LPKELGQGPHRISALYGGDEHLNNSDEVLVDLVVSGTGTPTTTAVATSTPTPSPYQPFTLTATVTGNGPKKPTGTVSFTVGGRTFGTPAALVDGVAKTESRFYELGRKEVTAVYLPTGGYATSTGTLARPLEPVPLPTTTKLTSSKNPSSPDQPVSISATVSSPWTTPQGRVHFEFDGQALPADYDLIDGVATVEISPSFFGGYLSPGPHTITARYYGYSAEFGGSDATLQQQVGPTTATTTSLETSDPRIGFGQAVRFTAQVKGATGGELPSGTVQFAVDDQNVGDPVKLVDGRARSDAVDNLPVGNHKITAAYTGTMFEHSASDAILDGGETVAPAVTKTELTSSNNPYKRGEPAFPEFTVRVDAKGSTPTGSVTFNFDSYHATVGLVDGKAVIELPISVALAMGPGLHPATVEYQSDTPAYAGSSDSLEQSVIWN
jgi:hypothetical protein